MTGRFPHNEGFQPIFFFYFLVCKQFSYPIIMETMIHCGRSPRGTRSQSAGPARLNSSNGQPDGGSIVKGGGVSKKSPLFSFMSYPQSFLFFFRPIAKNISTSVPPWNRREWRTRMCSRLPTIFTIVFPKSAFRYAHGSAGGFD